MYNPFKTKSTLLAPCHFRLFFRGVCFYINDYSAWRNFALTCPYFAELCREYAPMKKNEFRVTIRQWMRQFTSREPQYVHAFLPSQFDVPLVLPNGMLHGSVKTGMHEGIRINTGKIQLKYSYDIHGNGRAHIVNPRVVTLSFIRHIIIYFSDLNPLFNARKVIFCDLSQNKCINGSSCEICDSIHRFRAEPSFISYERNCLETSYRLVNTNATNMQRRRIAHQIIEYAKLKKKHLSLAPHEKLKCTRGFGNKMSEIFYLRIVRAYPDYKRPSAR